MAKDRVPWPDLTIILTIALFNLESETPKAALINCKYVGADSVSEKYGPFIENLIREITAYFTKTAPK